jgi:probable HAF family extracellular repeat protein
MRILGVVVTLLSLLVPVSSPVWGQQLTFTDLGWGTAAYGINDAGQIVGTVVGEGWCDGPSMCRSEALYHGFRTNPYIGINYPRANFYFTPAHTAYTKAYGISATGQIVGWARNDTGLHAFLRDTNGGFTTIGALYPYGINASGQIVGGNGQGFLLSGRTLTTIAPPGALSSAASGINDAGQIVGWFSNAAGTHGFLLSGSTFTTIDVPGAALGTQALGISATGQIVGVFTDAKSVSHGFLLSDGTFATVDVPVTMGGNTVAHGINVNGQIAGTFVDANQTVHGFLASP